MLPNNYSDYFDGEPYKLRFNIPPTSIFSLQDYLIKASKKKLIDCKDKLGNLLMTVDIDNNLVTFIARNFTKQNTLEISISVGKIENPDQLKGKRDFLFNVDDLFFKVFTTSNEYLALTLTLEQNEEFSFHHKLDHNFSCTRGDVFHGQLDDEIRELFRDTLTSVKFEFQLEQNLMEQMFVGMKITLKDGKEKNFYIKKRGDVSLNFCFHDVKVRGVREKCRMKMKNTKGICQNEVKRYFDFKSFGNFIGLFKDYERIKFALNEDGSLLVTKSDQDMVTIGHFPEIGKREP